MAAYAPDSNGRPKSVTEQCCTLNLAKNGLPKRANGIQPFVELF